MKKLSEDVLRVVYDLAQEKARYDAGMANWKRPAGIAGLFARRPRDPFPEGMDRLRELFGAAFRGAYPEVNDFRAGDRSLSDYKGEMHVYMDGSGKVTGSYHSAAPGWVHDEHYEFKPGYGLQFSYQHSDDPEKNAANRNYAYAMGMNNRFKDVPFLRVMNEKVDRVRSGLAFLSHPLVLPRRERDARLREAAAFLLEERAERDRVNVETKKHVPPSVESVADYVKAKAGQESLREGVVAGRIRNSPELVVRFGMDEAALDRYRSRADAGGLADELAKMVSPAVREEEMMSFSKKDYELTFNRNPDLPDNKVGHLFEFARLARLDGWDRDSIMKAVEEEAGRYSVVLTDRNRRTVRERIDDVDEKRVKALDDAVKAVAASTGSGNGDALEAALSEYRSRVGEPVRGLVKLQKDVSDAEVFLSVCRKALKTDKPSPEQVGAMMVDMNTSVPEFTVAQALAFADGRGVHSMRAEDYRSGLFRGVKARLVERFEKGVEGLGLADVFPQLNSGGAGFEHNPVSLVASDLAAAAFHISEKEPEKLGEFLNYTGLGRCGSSAAEDFMHAAKVMYRNGDAESARRVMMFREKYSEAIREGMKVVRAAQYQGKAEKVKKGLSV